TDAELGLSQADREAFAARDAAVLASGEALLDQRETLLGADGNEVHYLASRVPLRDAAGGLIGVLGVLVAIPE
ncbi:MAG TPA: PAS domain-containing protein, partial [Thermoleophilia bacterium]|nr:PAS domain-containing protein [Thermoleophilia bacterium]